jgi:hypothetical protein
MGQRQVVEHPEGFSPSSGKRIGPAEEKIQLIVRMVLPEALETESNRRLIVS